MEARSQSAAHPNEMNFIFNLNAFSWKVMQRTASQPAIYLLRVYHPRFCYVASCTELAVADLVSR